MLKKYSFLIAIGFIWGSQYIFQKEAIEHFSPIIIGISRSIIGCLVLCLICIFLRLKSISSKNNYLLYSSIAFFEATLPFILVPWGQQFISSSITAVLTGTVPFFVVIFGPLIVKSKITLNNLFSIGLGFIGLLILFYPNIISESLNLNIFGILAILTATMSFALALLLLSKSCFDENPIIVSRNILIASTIQLFIVALIFQPNISNINYSGFAISSLLYLGIACGGVVYYLYASLIRLAGPIFTSFTNYLVPIFGVIFGILINHDSSNITVWISLVVTLSAISLNYITRH